MDAFLAEAAAGLRTGVVEFAGLADDDWPGADDEDRADGIVFQEASGWRPTEREAGREIRLRPTSANTVQPIVRGAKVASCKVWTGVRLKKLGKETPWENK